MSEKLLAVSHLADQSGKPLGLVITVGGLYGHSHGEGEDVLDDPAVELLLDMQHLELHRFAESVVVLKYQNHSESVEVVCSQYHMYCMFHA